jgi:hypothetical protein
MVENAAFQTNRHIQEPPGTGAQGRIQASAVNGVFYDDDIEIGTGDATETLDSNELMVSDTDSVTLYLEYTSDADDDDENIIVHVVTTPDTEDNYETVAFQIPFGIKETLTGDLKTRPPKATFITTGAARMKIIAVQNTSTSADVNGVNVRFRKDRMRI